MIILIILMEIWVLESSVCFAISLIDFSISPKLMHLQIFQEILHFYSNFS